MLIRNHFISIAPSDGSLPSVPLLEFSENLARCLRCGRNRDSRLSSFNARVQLQLMNELRCRDNGPLLVQVIGNGKEMPCADCTSLVELKA